MISVCKTFEFEAAHWLPGYEGDCRNMHGHSYRLHVEVSGPINDATGMVLDFSILKEIVRNKIISMTDHKVLNDTFPTPTAEVMVDCFSYYLKQALPVGIILERVRLWETSSSWAEWKRDR
uniref:Putative 6-Pyruvoyl tetrahydrobiopterin synthase n=1 Tax=viral metagenome TaxID=1070528 RepID=A0A6M3IJS2_9ZZZZ